MPKVVIYTTSLCGYCHRAKMLLTQKGVPFTEIDVSGDPDGRAQMRKRSGGANTVPQIFIGDVHVGGCDGLFALEKRNALDPLLAS
jgi:glutaredoxin 3